MIPSNKLRKIISKKTKINLDVYKWDPILFRKILKISISDKELTHKALRYIYINGYNIGNCFLTSYYIASLSDDAKICSGRVQILKGTKNCEFGFHNWIELDNVILDPTLMISIPKSDPNSILYIKDSEVPRMENIASLSYINEEFKRIHHPIEYYDELYET